MRMPETLPPEARRPLDAGHLLAATRFVLTEPTSILYTLALAVLYGSVLTFISLMPQILADVYGREQLLGIVFALCAGTMALANLVNSRYVERLGMRRLSHAALAVFIAIATLHVAVATLTSEPLYVFVPLQAATMASFALTAPNFGAIAMQPMAHIAGSAASLQGVISTIGGALVATAIGWQWSGSVALLPAGSLCCGLVALACVATAKRLGRRHAPASVE
jgi:DHA1 family bicyclomycin/chloramphenicol resistance-like MFS transporter